MKGNHLGFLFCFYARSLCAYGITGCVTHLYVQNFYRQLIVYQNMLLLYLIW